MAEVHIARDFDKPADELWSLIGDFHGLHKWMPNLEPTESVEGGTARQLKMGPGAVITERLVDEGERSYTYTMDPGVAPLVNYRSTISVIDAGDGKSTVDWHGKFDPAEGTTEEAASQMVTVIYEGGLAGLEKTLSS